MNKVCGQCRAEKPSDMFHARSMSKDGLAACCKECQRRYDANRLHKPARVSAREAYRVTEYGRERLNAGAKAWVVRNPSKRTAHIRVGSAVKRGDIVKLPCEVCGDENSQAHHDDYSKPMEVRWLCTPHHAEHHKLERERSRSCNFVSKRI